jgi:hypothetical protein
MKKFIKYTFLGLGTAMFIFACKKNNLVVDKNIVAPAYAKFNTIKDADTIGSYYIKSSNDPFKLPIGVTNVSNKDRTVNFVYTSTNAAQGVQYNAPTSLVIKAGQALDSLTISGLFSGYPSSSRKDTLRIAISDGEIPASAYKSVYKLIMRKYCNVNINDFLGDYTNSTDRQGSGAPLDPYTAKIISVTSTGPTSASAIVYNFGDPMFGAPYNSGDLAVNPGITINLDWADPANFKVTVPSQAIAVGYYGSNGLIKAASSGTGTFSSCDNTFTVKYSFAIGSSSYGDFTTVLKR